jgi:hypothetical protein
MPTHPHTCYVTYLYSSPHLLTSCCFRTIAPDVTVGWVTLLLRIHTVTDSNLGPSTDCRVFFMVLLSLSRHCQDRFLDSATTAIH